MLFSLSKPLARVIPTTRVGMFINWTIEGFTLFPKLLTGIRSLTVYSYRKNQKNWPIVSKSDWFPEIKSGLLSLIHYISGSNGNKFWSGPTFLLNGPPFWKMRFQCIPLYTNHCQSQDTISGTFRAGFRAKFMIRFLVTTWKFLTHMRWLTPHFRGNCNTFLVNTIFLYTNQFVIFVNMPTFA